MKYFRIVTSECKESGKPTYRWTIFKPYLSVQTPPLVRNIPFRGVGQKTPFCELGAFSINKELRKKLIVINDYNYRKSGSFINLGPIKAISEIADGKQILYYKMDQRAYLNKKLRFHRALWIKKLN